MNLEFNTGRFDHVRGLSHAVECNVLSRNGDIVIGGAMPNLSQPWRVYQSDWKAVLWTQGNIYYTQDKVWFQSAYYVDQMIARHWASEAVKAQCDEKSLDVFVAKTADDKVLKLRVVNIGAEPITAHIALRGFVPQQKDFVVETLCGAPFEFNSLEEPEKIKPQITREPLAAQNGTIARSFAPYSFTILGLE